MDIDELKSGDRVKLLWIDGRYFISKLNPLKHTSYECVGTVDWISGENAAINWDNGEWNYYWRNLADFELVEAD